MASDLYTELGGLRPGRLFRIVPRKQWWNIFPWVDALWRARRIDRLAQKIDSERLMLVTLKPQDRETKLLEAEAFDRLRELNYLMLEELYPNNMPWKKV